MDQSINVLLWQSTHSTTEGPELQTRLRWVKPGLWAQPSHFLCLVSFSNNCGLEVISFKCFTRVQMDI